MIISKKKQEKIDELLEEMGAVGMKDGGRWRGKRVIVPEYEKEEKIGLPLVIFVTMFGVRLSTNGECLEYLEYTNK